MNFIITDVVTYNGGVRLHTGTSSNMKDRFIGGYANYGSNHQGFHFESGIVVPAGENLYCSAENAYPQVSISGYYAQP